MTSDFWWNVSVLSWVNRSSSSGFINVFKQQGALLLVDLAGVGFGEALIQDLTYRFLNAGAAGGLLAPVQGDDSL